MSDVHDIVTAEISIHALKGSPITVKILFTNYGCIHALFSGQFTDHSKPLPDPVFIIGSRRRTSTFHLAPSLSIDGTPIKQVSQTISLGVLIDQNLSWSEHIKLTKKLHPASGP